MIIMNNHICAFTPFKTPMSLVDVLISTPLGFGGWRGPALVQIEGSMAPGRHGKTKLEARGRGRKLAESHRMY